MPNEQNYYRIIIKDKVILDGMDEVDVIWSQQEVLIDKEIVFNDIQELVDRMKILIDIEYLQMIYLKVKNIH